MSRHCLLLQIEHSNGEHRIAQLADQTTVEATICQHRGELLRQEKSKLCGGCGRVTEVFACALHRECSPLRTDRLVRACISCDDLTVAAAAIVTP